MTLPSQRAEHPTSEASAYVVDNHARVALLRFASVKLPVTAACSYATRDAARRELNAICQSAARILRGLDRAVLGAAARALAVAARVHLVAARSLLSRRNEQRAEAANLVVARRATYVALVHLSDLLANEASRTIKTADNALAEAAGVILAVGRGGSEELDWVLEVADTELQLLRLRPELASAPATFATTLSLLHAPIVAWLHGPRDARQGGRLVELAVGVMSELTRGAFYTGDRLDRS